ncbi:hypothetical protein GCM10020229_57010 [Kitasatospora albolonga]
MERQVLHAAPSGEVVVARVGGECLGARGQAGAQRRQKLKVGARVEDSGQFADSGIFGVCSVVRQTLWQDPQPGSGPAGHVEVKEKGGPGAVDPW